MKISHYVYANINFVIIIHFFMLRKKHHTGIILDALTIPLCPKLHLHNVSNSKFSLGITVFPKEIEDGYANFRGGRGGVNKVHYGLCENHELSVGIHTTSPLAPGVPGIPGFPSSP